jgi:hypothetical protein
MAHNQDKTPNYQNGGSDQVESEGESPNTNIYIYVQKLTSPLDDHD